MQLIPEEKEDGDRAMALSEEKKSNVMMYAVAFGSLGGIAILCLIIVAARRYHRRSSQVSSIESDQGTNDSLMVSITC